MHDFQAVKPHEVESRKDSFKSGHGSHASKEVDESKSKNTSHMSTRSLQSYACAILHYMRNSFMVFSIKAHSKYALGVFLIVSVAFIWVAASACIKYILGDLNYNKPYFLTFFNTFGFSFWNLGYLFSKKWQMKYVTAKQNIQRTFERDETNAGDVEKATRLSVNTDTEVVKNPYSMKKLFIATAIFCPLWFIANTLFNFSLSCTSVSTNTILSSSSSVWTLFLSYFVLNQSIRPLHVFAVCLSVGGSVLVCLASRTADSTSTWVGISAAAIAAAFYAAYTVALKRVLPDDECYSMGMVFGMLGILNSVVFWPGFFILHMTGLEVFEVPPRQTLLPLVLNAIIGTNLSEVLWAKGVILTSPLVATLGLSLTTPMAMIFDLFIKHHSFSLMYVMGAIIVTAGFTLCNLQ